MKIPSKTTVLRAFKYMYTILIIVSVLAAYIDYKQSLYGLAMYCVFFLCSELPIRIYYSGKPLLEFGSFNEAKTENDINTHLCLHLTTIFVGFLVILGNAGYIFLNYV